MPEHQSIEWKETWRDECLKWICGFANAGGGVLVIGKNNKGIPVGVSGARKLLEDIPNKVRDVLGILVDVNLRKEEGADIIEIVVEPYPYPISYKGESHYRSGSTKQELKGAALDRFLLRKQGRHWDGVPVPKVGPVDLDPHSLATFRKRSHRSKRLTPDIANAFFRAGDIESWGRGIERIMSTCREARSPEPFIEYSPGDLWVKFPFSPAYLAGASTGPDAGKSSGKSSGKTEDKIIAIVRESPGISIPEIAKLLGLSTRAVEKQIRQLKATSRLRRIGPAKGGRWEGVV